MLIQRIQKQKNESPPKSSVRYIVGARPADTLVGKRVRLRNIKRSKSTGVIMEVIEPTRAVAFGKNHIPKNIKVNLVDDSIMWVAEREILKVYL